MNFKNYYKAIALIDKIEKRIFPNSERDNLLFKFTKFVTILVGVGYMKFEKAEYDHFFKDINMTGHEVIYHSETMEYFIPIKSCMELLENF